MPKERVLFKNQDYNKIRKECLEKKELFYDEFFRLDVPDAMWLRPGKIVKEPHFFVEGASRFDVKQGANSGCWLLVAMANLTMNPTMFDHVVPKDQKFSEDYAGIFRFNIWRCGRWIEVVIDDRLPTKEGVDGARKLMYTHSKEKNEFWSALLEKAYAKLYGSYNELTAGWFNESMVDFTGGIVERVEVSLAADRLEKIFEKSLAKGSFICAFMADDPAIKELVLPNGLVKGHAYGLTRFVTVYPEDKKVCLLRLRNPWGKVEWAGPWSDRSKHWSSLTPEVKQKLGIVCDEDGEFWMPLEAFTNNFDYLDICHLTPEVYGAEDTAVGWQLHAFRGHWTKGVNAGGRWVKTFYINPQYRIVLKDSDDGDGDNLCTLLIGLMQKNKTRKVWHKIGFTAYKLEGPEKDSKEPLSEKYIKDNFDNSFSSKLHKRREIVVRIKWEPGVYVFMPSTDKPGLEAQYLLRIFSEKAAHAEEPGVIGRESIYNILEDDTIEIPDEDTQPVIEFREPVEDIRPQQDLKLLQRNDQEIFDYFRKVAGGEKEIGWKGLQSILEYAMKQPSDTASMGFLDKIIAWITNLIHGQSDNKIFTKEECRSLISVLDEDLSGKLSLKEFEMLWKNLLNWEFVFKNHCRGSSMDTSNLAWAMRETGWSVKYNDLSRLARMYADKDGKLGFDDFVMCIIDRMTAET